MKRAIFLIPVFLSFTLSGCAFDTGIDTLLSPPKLTEEQEQIYTALKNYTGSEMILKYPRSGKNLSAFIMQDLDGDKKDEALVFYEKSGSGSGNGALRMNVLAKSDSRWRSVCDTEAAGREIEKVEIAKLGSNDKTSIIVGSSFMNINDRSFCVYDYSDGNISVSFENEPYSVFDTVDLNGDGRAELFTASAQTPSMVASAVIYCPDKDGSYKSSAVALNESYKGFRNVLYSGTGKTRSIFLDADTGNNIVTEVLSINQEGELFKEFTPNISDSATLRPPSYTSADMDGDGNAEIPVPVLCRGYTENSGDPLYFTYWYSVSEGQLVCKYRSWYSITNGFSFMIPDSWGSDITARRNINDNSVTLCMGDDPDSAEDIFTVRNVLNEDPSGESGYTLLRSRGGKRFLIKINSGCKLVKTAADLTAKFRFYE